jgi:hypothetical protein
MRKDLSEGLEGLNTERSYDLRASKQTKIKTESLLEK